MLLFVICMKIKYIYILALLAVSLLVMPVSAVGENNTPPQGFITGLKHFFDLLPPFAVVVNQTTQLAETVKHHPINNTTVDRATAAIQAFNNLSINNTTIERTTNVINVVNNISINASVVEKIKNAFQALEDIQKNRRSSS